jgi:hypothetical protein
MNAIKNEARKFRNHKNEARKFRNQLYNGIQDQFKFRFSEKVTIQVWTQIFDKVHAIVWLEVVNKVYTQLLEK